jgi:peptidoglycan-associated lipoprotein
MTEQLRRYFLVCAVAAFCVAGCAKQEVVKPDQAMAPVAASASATSPAPTTAAAAAKQETKDAGLTAQSIDESQAKKQAQPSIEPLQGAELKAGLEKVYFDFDSSALSQSARDTLAKNAQILKQGRAANIRIEGHCDELGSDDYNLALGERRAKAALDYLQTMGVPAERLSVISYGKEKPADPGHDDAARAKNRRDEFVLSSK